MKKVLVRVYDLKEDEKEITTIDLVKTSLAQPPKEGFDFATMSKRLKIDEKFDKAKEGESVELSDEQAEHLDACLTEKKWMVLNKEVAKFVEDTKADCAKTQD